MNYLKQATASQSRSIGPFVDDTDFKTAKTGLTIANTDIKLMVNGGASANKNSGGGTHRVNGFYGVTFDATDTATVGELEVSVVVAGALPVFKTFYVLEEAVFDALFAASAPGYVANAPVNVAQFGGTNGTFSSGRPEVNTSHAAGTAWNSGAIGATTLASDTIAAAKIASGAITSAKFAAGAIDASAIADNAIDAGAIASNAITAAKIATDAIGAAQLAADAVTEIQSGLSTLNAAGVRSAVGLASANLDTQLAAIDDFVDTEVGAIKTVVDAIQLKTDNLPSDPADASVIAGLIAAVETKVDTFPTAGGIADAVWDETLADHQGAGSTGEALDGAGGGGSGPTAEEIADAVWDEPIADHQDSGSVGESLNDAGAGGNPWNAVIEGSLTAEDLLRVLAAVAAGKTTIVAGSGETATVTFRDITDSSTIVEAQMDGSERESVAVTP